MNGGTVPEADWFTDPHDPSLLRYWDGTAWTDRTARAPALASAAASTQHLEPSEVLGRAVAYGLLIGVVTGTASGTVAAPVLGTIVGAGVGAFVALPASLIAATFISRSVASPHYRRRVDATLLVLGIATAALAIGWISLRPLVGPWPALTMLVVVVAGLLVVRPRLRRLGAGATTSTDRADDDAER
ncbi:MAG: DUF2510 domain-containing protein [Microthrixaceae bacterium]